MKDLDDLGFSVEEYMGARAENNTPTIPEETAVPPQLQDSINHSSFQTDQVIHLSQNSLDFLAALVMGDAFKYFFPPIYLAVWDWLKTYVHKSRDFSQLALGLPRGFSKTTVVKLFLLYVILFTNKRFILICAENQTKANNILADVMDMLTGSNILNVFGDWRIGAEVDRQDLKKFGFRGRNIIVMAGTVTTIRGANLKNERPDIMVFDDIQSRKMAESQTESEALEREMIGTAMKAKSPHGCLFIFIGNMYPTKWSILRRLKKNPNWIKFIAGGLLLQDNGEITSLWEELQPKEQLLKEFVNDLESGRPEIFYSEVLNDENATSNYLIDISKLPPCPYVDESTHHGNYIIIDPSNDKHNSDAVAIGYFEVFEEKPVLKELVSDRLSPGDTIKKALDLAMTHGCRIVGIESNAYQYSLHYWFRFICEQYGIIGIDSVELYSGHRSKNSRILDMFKSLAAGEIFYTPAVSALVNTEIVSFNPLKTNNVDNVLDLLTYSPKMLSEYGEYIRAGTIIIQQEIGTITVPEFNSPF